jgi:hypothetical protein
MDQFSLVKNKEPIPVSTLRGPPFQGIVTNIRLASGLNSAHGGQNLEPTQVSCPKVQE